MNTYDKIRSYFSPGYAARVGVLRALDIETPELLRPSLRAGAAKHPTSSDWGGEPFGARSGRTLTPGVRRTMVRRARHLADNNILAGPLVQRSADNIIGTGMQPQARTSDPGFNKAVEEFWDGYSPDARGVLDMGEWQHAVFCRYKTDGDVGGIKLTNGLVQVIESDLITSPTGGDHNANKAMSIFDGVRVDAVGRPLGYYVDSQTAASHEVAADAFLFLKRGNRFSRQATRGAPLLAELGELLDQIDGTVEAVVMAHRISALFGAVITKKNPEALGNGLPTTTRRDGTASPTFKMSPGMVIALDEGEGIEQVKPEHPTTNFGDFMTFLIRLAGVRFSLPLELALMDFSRTNYSSARASMEQAYRAFGVDRRAFSGRILRPLYLSRISMAITDGDLRGAPADWYKHVWHGQPWPYLDPVKDAQGVMASIDLGATTLSAELLKRGTSFNEWLDVRGDEIKRQRDAGIPLIHSRLTRDATPEPADAQDV